MKYKVPGRADFDTAGEYVSRRRFRFDGADYPAGKAFNVTKNPLRSFHLYKFRWIEPAATQPETEDRPDIKLARPHVVVDAGFGWFEVADTATGETVSERKMRRVDAEALAKQLTQGTN